MKSDQSPYAIRVPSWLIASGSSSPTPCRIGSALVVPATVSRT
ncbi:MAG: hypothetical protein V9G04_02345 [Nocardioides sp.]